MKQADDETERYAQFGMAAIIPGIQHAITVLQEMLDTMRIELAAYQGRRMLPTVKTPRKRRAGIDDLPTGGRPRKPHPRDLDHPGHAAWVAKLQRGVKKARRARVKAAKEAKAAA
jgi:hypothetical protein